MIITFSGIDSSGKTTQLNLFYNSCVEKGFKVQQIWGKGRGTPGVMLIKRIVRRDRGMDAEEKKEYRKNIYKSGKKRRFLLVASILDLWWYFGIYYRFLNIKNDILICDRYIWDTYIDFRSEFPEANIDNWLIWKIAIALAPTPKYSFMFYITAEESYKRDQQKGDLTLDSLDIKRAKVDKYLKLIEKNKWNVVVDGTREREDISAEINNKIFNL